MQAIAFLAGAGVLGKDAAGMTEKFATLAWAKTGNAGPTEAYVTGSLLADTLVKLGGKASSKVAHREALRVETIQMVADYVHAHPRATPAELQSHLKGLMSLFIVKLALLEKGL